MSAFLQINQLLSLRRYEEAAELARLALAEDPANPSLFGLLAEAYIGLGKHDWAIKTANQGLAQSPSSPTLLSTRARAESGLHHHDRALEDYLSALGTDPEYVAAHIGVVEATQPIVNTSGKRKTNDLLAQARKSSNYLMDERPELHWSHLMDAKVCIMAQDFDAALVAAERGLAIEPNEPIGHQLRGVALESLGDIRGAGDAYVAAGQLDPSSETSGNLLDGLSKAGAPIGIGAFLLFRFLTRVGQQSSESTGFPVALVFIGALVIVGVFLYGRKRIREAETRRQLSPEAARVQDARKETRS